MIKKILKKLEIIIIFLLSYISIYSQTNCKGFDANDFVFNGKASVTGSNEVTLTPDSYAVYGTLWSQQKVLFSQDFTIDADLFLGSTDGPGADGIAFVIQPLSSNAGEAGGGMGYQGISPSFAIEFDTWFNSGMDPITNDHVALMKNGDVVNHSTIAPYIDLGNIEDGKWHRTLIEWKAAAKTLKLTFDGVVLYNLSVDLKSIFLNNDSVFWGFTAATGAAKNLQKVKIYNYCVNYASSKAPTGNGTQVFCTSPAPILANLSAVGNNIKWYASAVGGVPLPAETLLLDGTMYYATQTIDGVESNDRLAVKAIINNPQITASATEICSGNKVDLTVGTTTGTSGLLYSTTKDFRNAWQVNWLTTKGANYILKVAGTYGITTTSGIDTDAAYYIKSKTPYNQPCTGYQDRWLLIDNCPMRPTPDVYNSNNIYFYYINNSDGSVDFKYSDSAYNDNSGSLTFELYDFIPTYLWSTGETTPKISVIPSKTTEYWVDVTINGVTCRKTITITVNSKITPTFTPVEPVCAGSTLSALPTTSLNGIKGAWSPSLNNTTTTTYTFTPDAGQCADVATMTITVNPLPSAPTGNPVQVFCGSPLATVSNLIATGSNIKWYTTATGGTALSDTTTLLDGSSYYASQTIDACESRDRLAVKVIINNPQITANATEVCAGTAVQLSVDNVKGSTAGWKLLIPSSQYNGSLLNLSETGYDRTNNIIYSLYKGSALTFYAFNLNNNTVSTVNTTNIPASIGPFTFDDANKRIIAGRTGRESLYAIPTSGGAWSQVSAGSSDMESYGAQYFWNSKNNKVAFFGGYGLYSVKNWVWENGGNWTNVYANNTICNTANPAKRNTQLALSAPGENKIFFFSGQGSCSGDQFAKSCTSGSGWATDVGVYCWLKDLWSLDLNTYTFSNLLPVNHSSITKEGTFTYNYKSNTFYILGGYVPSSVYSPSYYNTANFENTVLKYTPGIDTGFVPISIKGTPPPLVSVNNMGINKAYFDETNNQVVWIRKDGVWAIDLNDETTVSYLWSTGETTPSISVTPSKTSDYWVDVTINGVTCRKNITITVNPKITPTFTPVAPICAGSTLSALTTTSLNGVKGIWSPALNNTTTTTYTFTPDAGQCADSVSMTITVNPVPATPTGNPVQVFCGSPVATVSNLTATGSNIKWYTTATGGTALSNTTTLLDGIIYYASQTVDGCESSDRLAVKVVLNNSEIAPSKSIICPGENVSLKAGEDLPTICNMNITLTKIPLGDPIPGFTYKGKYNGHYYYVYNKPTTWTQGEAICRANGGYLVCINDINENNFVSNLTNNNIWIGMFRDPKTGNFRWLDCMDITFTNWRPGEPNNGPFGEPYVQIIRGCTFGLNTWNNLDDNSANGSCYSNMVPIMEIDPSIYTNSSGLSTSYLWSTGETTPNISVTPSKTTEYWVDVTINGVTCRKTIIITVNSKVTPTFTPIETICSGTTLSALPNTSLNGVKGTWSPALNNTTTTTYTFTPDTGQCADSVSMTITVNPKITPSFNTVGSLCEGDQLLLPKVSTNGIKGTWIPNINNTITTTYTFIPDADQCASTTTMTVVVNPKISPNFNQISPICYGTTLSPLPTTSLNGIKGTWSPYFNNKETTTYTFTPDSNYCASSTEMTIQVNPVEDIKYRLTTSGNNIIVEVLNFDSSIFEYSIDNVNWQIFHVFNNLPNNNYKIYIRNKTGCIVSIGDILLLNVPNAITPNDDGINDKWTIPGIEKYPKSKITVLDRFGNVVLEKIAGNNFYWDGKFLLRPLPTGTYWYIIKLDNGTEIKGYLLIKNRN